MQCKSAKRTKTLQQVAYQIAARHETNKAVLKRSTVLPINGDNVYSSPPNQKIIYGPLFSSCRHKILITPTTSC